MRIASDVTTVQGAQKALAAAGHEFSAPNRITMRAHRYCDEPKSVDLHSRTGSSVVNRNGGDRPIGADILLPCRRCAGCLLHRARTLTAKGEVEISRSSRTWLLMLSASLDAQMMMGGAQPDSQDYRQAWIRTFQRYMKRLRKNVGAPLRYMAVLERHKSGLYHMHVLLHECGVPILARILQGQWLLGSIRSTLVVHDPRRTARYVVKYLTKEPDAWIRCSNKYGAVPPTQLDALSIAKRDGVSPRQRKGSPLPHSPEVPLGSPQEALSSEPGENGLYVDAHKRSTLSISPAEARLADTGVA